MKFYTLTFVMAAFLVLLFNQAYSASISSGDVFNCGITNSGVAKCWGGNGSGQLGNGATIDSHMPVDVVGLQQPLVMISAGGYHACAVNNNGGVQCWGNNQQGQLGDGTTIHRSTPVQVVRLSAGVISVVAAEDFSCALTQEGSVKCWGANYYGQLGNGSFTSSSTPVDVKGLQRGIIALAAMGCHACALTSSGAVKCWGLNNDGELGNGTNINSNIPVDVDGLHSGVTAITAGHSHSCAVTIDGAMTCWGQNKYGQLGDNSTQSSNVPVKVYGLRAGVEKISAGLWHTCMMTYNHVAQCWGSNINGSLGNGTEEQSDIPVKVHANQMLKEISSGDFTTCALTVYGQAQCWGSNQFGKLGNDSTVNNSTLPVDVIHFD